MHHLSLLISAASIIVSILVSRFLTLRIIDRLNRRAGQTAHFLATPAGSAILFALVFVVVWCVVSFLMAIPWLLSQLLNVLTISADYAQSSSGGPILNEHRAVVGMVCQTLTISDDNDQSQMTWKFARLSRSILLLLQGTRCGKPTMAQRAEVQ